MSSFLKDFDTILNAILTDYRNQFAGVDTSQGSLVFIKSACLASALWGLYRYQNYIAQQIFPDTADTSNLEHHVWVRGLVRRTSETDSELLARLLEYIRRPPAGGNKYDYIKWALEIDNVAAAWCLPLAQGDGTVDVLILSDEDVTGSEIPSTHTDLSGTVSSVSELLLVDSTATFLTDGVAPGDIAQNTSLDTEAVVVSVDGETQLTLVSDIFLVSGQGYALVSLAEQVWAYIDDLRPVTADTMRVLAPTPVSQNVTMTVYGDNIDLDAIILDITDHMANLEPGQDLILSKLIALAMVADGVTDAAISVPATNVSPDDDEMIRPGTIGVTLG